MYSKIAVYLFFSFLCFVSYAQKHAVIKWKDCEVVIYNTYGNLGEQEEHNPLFKTIKNDTVFAEVVGVFGHEIQGKKLKLTSTIADSFAVEQSYLMNFGYEDEQHYRVNYLPYKYRSEWQKLQSITKNKFKIISYIGNPEKLTPYKTKNLSLKEAKKYVIDVYKKEYANNQDNKTYYEEQIGFIKSIKKLEDLMNYSLDYLYLRITLFKEGKKSWRKVYCI
jgi:hypothetical protein